ncbi:MAG: DinB family protein [Pyrinomonadaceae bacterium]
MRPEANEAAPYYSRYIDLVSSDNIIGVMEAQLREIPEFLSGISEEKSRHRYAPGKWSIRQLLNHVNDTERIFLFRALWFGRGFENPLPGYDQDVCAEASGADDVSWVNHAEEFRSVRLATLALFQNLPEEAWLHKGSANGSPISVRALAYIIAGHVQHHTTVLKERYL